MANVRLLRQSIDDYNARVARLDAQYRTDYDKYTADVKAFNADVEAHPNDPAQSNLLSRQQYIVGHKPDRTVQALNSDGAPLFDDNGQPIMTTIPGEKIYANSPTTLPTPVAPQQSVAPPLPNLTNNDYKVMADPGTDPAGVVRANNKGYTGNSEIAAMNDTPMRNSAFADPADPQGLKERGILARVMGGQL